MTYDLKPCLLCVVHKTDLVKQEWQVHTAVPSTMQQRSADFRNGLDGQASLFKKCHQGHHVQIVIIVSSELNEHNICFLSESRTSRYARMSMERCPMSESRIN